MKYIGLLDELAESMRQNGLGDPSSCVKCVIIGTNAEGSGEWISFDQFKDLCQKNDSHGKLVYDRESGEQVINEDIRVVLNDNSFFRRDYEGAYESWDYVPRPTRPDNFIENGNAVANSLIDGGGEFTRPKDEKDSLKTAVLKALDEENKMSTALNENAKPKTLDDIQYVIVDEGGIPFWISASDFLRIADDVAIGPGYPENVFSKDFLIVGDGFEIKVGDDPESKIERSGLLILSTENVTARDEMDLDGDAGLLFSKELDRTDLEKDVREDYALPVSITDNDDLIKKTVEALGIGEDDAERVEKSLRCSVRMANLFKGWASQIEKLGDSTLTLNLLVSTAKGFAGMMEKMPSCSEMQEMSGSSGKDGFISEGIDPLLGKIKAALDIEKERVLDPDFEDRKEVAEKCIGVCEKIAAACVENAENASMMQDKAKDFLNEADEFRKAIGEKAEKTEKNADSIRKKAENGSNDHKDAEKEGENAAKGSEAVDGDVIDNDAKVPEERPISPDKMDVPLDQTDSSEKAAYDDLGKDEDKDGYRYSKKDSTFNTMQAVYRASKLLVALKKTMSDRAEPSDFKKLEVCVEKYRQSLLGSHAIESFTFDAISSAIARTGVERYESIMKKYEALPESDKVDRQVLLCEAAAERDAANIAFARIDGGKSKKEEAAKKEFRSVGKRLESISNIFDDKASVGEKALGDLIKDYAEQAKAIGASEYTKGGYEVMRKGELKRIEDSKSMTPEQKTEYIKKHGLDDKKKFRSEFEKLKAENAKDMADNLSRLEGTFRKEAEAHKGTPESKKLLDAADKLKDLSKELNEKKSGNDLSERHGGFDAMGDKSIENASDLADARGGERKEEAEEIRDRLEIKKGEKGYESGVKRLVDEVRLGNIEYSKFKNEFSKGMDLLSNELGARILGPKLQHALYEFRSIINFDPLESILHNAGEKLLDSILGMNKDFESKTEGDGDNGGGGGGGGGGGSGGGGGHHPPAPPSGGALVKTDGRGPDAPDEGQMALEADTQKNFDDQNKADSMANKTSLESNGNAIDRGNDSVGAEHNAINSKTIESASDEAEGVESGDTDYYAPSEDEEEAASDFAESEGECDEEEIEEIVEAVFA